MDTLQNWPEDLFFTEPKLNPRRQWPSPQAILAEVKAMRLTDDLQTVFDHLVDSMEEWFNEKVEYVTYEETLSVGALFLPKELAKDPIYPDRVEKSLIDLNIETGLAVLQEQGVDEHDWLPFLIWRPGKPTDSPRLWRPYGRWDFPPVPIRILNETEGANPRARAEMCAAASLEAAT
jgi:hypothetical protein